MRIEDMKPNRQFEAERQEGIYQDELPLSQAIVAQILDDSLMIVETSDPIWYR